MLPDGSEETQFSGGAVNEIAWSPDGTKIAYYASSDIWVVKSTGGAPARLTNLTGVNTQPAWSPDGTKIAFISNRDGNNEIYVMNADGTGQTRLTLHVANDQAPAWSVSGNKIAFATNRDGNYEIYTMNTNGTSLTRLTNSIGDDLNPVYSPDGGSIAFTSTRDGGASEIYTMHYDGTQQRRLTNNSFSEASPTWSPDGAVLAYSSDRNSNTDIYALDLGSLIETRLTSHPEDDFKPAWSPFFTQRSLIGASMPLGSSASGVIYTGKGDDAASVVTFSVSDFTQVKMSLANAQETNGAWITYVVEGATNPISFAGFNLWNFSNIAPTPVTLPVGTNGALVQISATTGRVLYILPYTAPNRSANSSLKPAVVTQAGQRVLHGNFNGVYDAQGRNIAPNGAHEVRFDAQTGNLIYLQ
jgi:Tol biopolymer transport system component